MLAVPSRRPPDGTGPVSTAPARTDLPLLSIRATVSNDDFASGCGTDRVLCIEMVAVPVRQSPMITGRFSALEPSEVSSTRVRPRAAPGVPSRSNGEHQRQAGRRPHQYRTTHPPRTRTFLGSHPRPALLGIETGNGGATRASSHRRRQQPSRDDSQRFDGRGLRRHHEQCLAGSAAQRFEGSRCRHLDEPTAYRRLNARSAP